MVNAYLLPAMRGYLSRLQSDLAAIGVAAPMQVMASNGGMIGIAAASDKPVFAVGIRPRRRRRPARRGSAPSPATATLIVFDMGGTTAKAAIIEGGQPAVVTEYEFRDGISTPSRFVKGGGYMLKVPAIDIAEVGAGRRLDRAHRRGRPAGTSARSRPARDPGPACYGRGNDRARPSPTPTWCWASSTRASLAGGSLRVDRGAARARPSRRTSASRSGLDVEDAAHGIREVANVSMARAIRAVTVERGRDPRDLTLMAFGGGGPLHAVDVARQLGITRVLVAPVLAGVFCAAGMLAARAGARIRARGAAAARQVRAGRRSQRIADDLARAGPSCCSPPKAIAAHAAAFERRADLRYLGQSSRAHRPAARRADGRRDVRSHARGFLAAYRETFGYAADEPVELVNLRLVAKGTGVERARLRQHPHGARRGRRRDRLAPGTFRTRPAAGRDAGGRARHDDA